MKKLLKILIAGPQASGKGTQTEILSKKFKLPIFSAGNTLRQRAQQADKLGKELAEIMKKGELVPDDLINQMMLEQIEKNGGKGYILDGWPRNLYQYEFFNPKQDLTYVIEVYITDKEAFRRISGRRTCAKCQTVYHLEYNPSEKEGVCDKCGGKLIVREDEKPKAVKERLGVYHGLTEPMLEKYKQQGIYHRIDGQQPIPKVSEDILKIL